MKPFLLLLLATFILADISKLRTQLPQCSIKCLAEGATAADCAVIDVGCQCGKMEEITKSVAPCMVRAECTLEEITDTAGMVAQICVEQYQKGTLTAMVGTTSTSTSGASETSGVAARAQIAGAVLLAVGAVIV